MTGCPRNGSIGDLSMNMGMWIEAMLASMRSRRSAN